MNNFQQNHRVRAFFASRAGMTILFLFLVGMGIVSFRALEAGWEARAERAAVEERLEKLEEDKNMLIKELEDLNSQEGIEREARQKLNFRKPGEEVVIIVDSEENGRAEEKAESFSLQGALKKVFNFIF